MNQTPSSWRKPGRWGRIAPRLKQWDFSRMMAFPWRSSICARGPGHHRARLRSRSSKSSFREARHSGCRAAIRRREDRRLTDGFSEGPAVDTGADWLSRARNIVPVGDGHRGMGSLLGVKHTARPPRPWTDRARILRGRLRESRCHQSHVIVSITCVSRAPWIRAESMRVRGTMSGSEPR